MYPTPSSAKPASEWPIDADLVRARLAHELPAYADRTVCVLGEGWDNRVFAVGDDAVARMPRHAAGVTLTLREQSALPRLPALPIPTPKLLFAGAGGEGFPHPWSLHRRCEGDPGAGRALCAPVEDAERLGAFLRALHVKAPADAPTNAFRACGLEARSEGVERDLHALGDAVDGHAVRQAWSALRHSQRGARTWLHADLHPNNVLIARGRISAIIDFGDVCAGDPAVDLAAGFMLFEGDARAALWRRYDADEGLVRRARGWALALGLTFAASAGDDDAFYAMGLKTVEQTTNSC